MKKPLKKAAIFGIVLVSLLFLTSLFSIVLSILYSHNKSLAIVLITTLALVLFLSYILFYSGFFVLSKKLNNKLLALSSTFYLAWPIIYAIVALALFLNFSKGIKIFNFPEVPHGAIINIAALSLFYLITLLFSVALFKIDKIIKYAKATGVIGIISTILGIIIFASIITAIVSNNIVLIFVIWSFGAIGSLVFLTFLIMQIVLLFKASYDFEK